MNNSIHMFRRLSSFGPALFLIGATIGTGSVSSLVVSGATHGSKLLWALLLSCCFYSILIHSMSRLTFATGETFISAVNKHLGRGAGFYIVLAILVGQFSSNIGVLGIVSEAFAAWTGMPFLASAFLWSSVVFFLLFGGRYNRFEKTIIALVAILAFSFMVDLFFVRPSLNNAVSGLVPSLPEGGAVVAAAMVGTTLAGSIVVMRSFVVKDKGWTLEDLSHDRKDAILSGGLIFFISAIVMLCASATMFASGKTIEQAIDMAYILEPLAGKLAASLFVVGIVAAGLSSAFPNTLVSYWTLADFLGKPRDPGEVLFKVMAILYCAAGLIAPLAGGRPVPIQIASLALQAFFMPLLILFMMILLNKSEAVNEYKASLLLNMLCGIALVFSSYMAFQAVVGLLGLLGY